MGRGDSGFTVFCLSGIGVFSCGGGMEDTYDDSENGDAEKIELDICLRWVTAGKVQSAKND